MSKYIDEEAREADHDETSDNEEPKKLVVRKRAKVAKKDSVGDVLSKPPLKKRKRIAVDDDDKEAAQHVTVSQPDKRDGQDGNKNSKKDGKAKPAATLEHENKAKTKAAALKKDKKTPKKSSKNDKDDDDDQVMAAEPEVVRPKPAAKKRLRKMNKTKSASDDNKSAEPSDPLYDDAVDLREVVFPLLLQSLSPLGSDVPQPTRKGCPFECRITEAAVLNGLFTGLKPLLDKVPIQFTPDGIVIDTFDKNQLAWLRIRLPRQMRALQNYHCPRTIGLVVTLKSFAENFADLQGDDVLTLRVPTADADSLDFEICSGDGKRHDKYREPTLDEEVTEPQKKDLNDPVRVRLPAARLKKACDRLARRCKDEEIYLEATPDSFKFKADEHSEHAYSASDEVSLHFPASLLSDRVEAKMNVKVLKEYQKLFSKIGGSLWIYFEPDTPMFVSQRLGQVGVLETAISILPEANE